MRNSGAEFPEFFRHPDKGFSGFLSEEYHDGVSSDNRQTNANVVLIYLGRDTVVAERLCCIVDYLSKLYSDS